MLTVSRKLFKFQAPKQPLKLFEYFSFPIRPHMYNEKKKVPMNDNKDFLDKLSVFSSKIMHDLVAPVSAIEMGVEYLSETIPSTNQAFQILKESVGRATAKLNFFRYAFSFAKTTSLSSSEYCKICSTFLGFSKIKFEGELNLETDALTQKAIACLLFLLADTLPKGGSIIISQPKNILMIKGSGPIVVKQDKLWDVLLSNTSSYLDPYNILFFVTKTALNQSGSSIRKFESTSESINIHLTKA